MKVRVKLGDSRSNGSRDIRLLHTVTNDDEDAGVRRHHIRAKRRFLPSNVSLWRRTKAVQELDIGDRIKRKCYQVSLNNTMYFNSKISPETLEASVTSQVKQCPIIMYFAQV